MIKQPLYSNKSYNNFIKEEKNICNFNTEEEFFNFFKNISSDYIEDIKIKTILYNIESNALFKYSSIETRKKIYNILKNNLGFKMLNKGNSYKLYLFIHDLGNCDDLEKIINKFSIDKIIISTDAFIDFILTESNRLYSKWNFPIEIKIDYNLLAIVTEKISDKKMIKKLSPIILILGKYIDFKRIDINLSYFILNEMIKKFPSNLKYFFSRRNDIQIYKVEKILDNLYIFFKNDILVLNLDNKNNMKSYEFIQFPKYRLIAESDYNFKPKSDEKDVLVTFKNLGYNVNELEIYEVYIVGGIVLSLALVSLFIYKFI